VPGTGRKVDLRFDLIMRVVDGRIADSWTGLSAAELGRELGLPL
jgi:hypothetical protein